MTVLARYSDTASKYQDSQTQVIETQKHSQAAHKALSDVKKEKTTIDTSLREERLKTAEKDKEIESLKVNLQAKKDREQSVQANLVSVKAPAVQVSGSCEDWLAQAGVTDMANARILIQRESGCNPLADNPNSDAYGIPQALPGSKMASHGADWATNPVTQLRWMQSYVMSRYGSWANAVNHSSTVGWY